MARDAQDNEVTGATAEAAAHYDEAVRAFALAYGDPIGAFDKARSAAPGFAMAHLGKAWIFALANDATLAPHAAPLLEAAEKLPLNERERAHAAAIAEAIQGHRAASVQILERHLMGSPRDLLAHYAAMLLDAFQGRFHCVRDRSARALPLWSKSTPSYGILLSFYGFGLEEAGNYAKSEDTSRAAAELEPYGYWPHHAVSHVMEMTGRPKDGLQWMDQRATYWSQPGNANRVHIWWHKALFHVELGEYDAAMALYDGPVIETQKPLGISMTNGAALLWRLEMLGYEGGARWKTLAAQWANHADGRLCLFADVHAAMAAIRAEDTAELHRLKTAMRQTAEDSCEQAAAYRLIGMPVVEGLAAFHRKDYAGVVEHLMPARYELWRLGGSHAQRDVFDWTLTEAAVRGGLRDVALALANERLGQKPGSVPNQQFLARAQAMAA